MLEICVTAFFNPYKSHKNRKLHPIRKWRQRDYAPFSAAGDLPVANTEKWSYAL